jgi:Tfp pilus assembly protein PilW
MFAAPGFTPSRHAGQAPPLNRPATAGLTLVEVVVAMSIVTVLTFAALRMIGSMSRSQKAHERSWQDSAGRDPIAAVMSADLWHATHYRVTPASFVTRNLSSLDPVTLDQHFLPAQVEYAIQRVAARQWLVRTQHPRVADQASLIDLVCPDVQAVTLESSGPPAEADGPWQVVGDTIAIQVQFATAGRQPLKFFVPTR